MINKLLKRFKKYCAGCKEDKFFVKRRTFYAKTLNTTITSNNPLCRKCIKQLKGNY